MADLSSAKIYVSLLVIIQAYHSGVLGWTRAPFRNEDECINYYKNMTTRDGYWCPTMWDGFLCWPPSPYNAVAFLPCPLAPGKQYTRRTVYKRCSPEGHWEDVEDPSSTPSGRAPREPLRHEGAHPCLGDSEDPMDSNAGHITDYRVVSRIEQRFAQTEVTATMVNTNTKPSQLQFKVTLPKNAYISSLVMEIDGTNFTSHVRRKSLANRSYQVAKDSGLEVALLEQKGAQEFEVRANIVSRQVTFYIKYEELLKRVNGQYIQNIYVKPGSRIPEAEVNVHIHELETLQDYRILELPGQELMGNPGAKVSESLMDDGEVQVHYKHVDPSNGSGKGVDGMFTIAYTLNNHVNGGKIKRMGSYFNHFLSLDASDHLQKMPSHTVFAIDVSNSMGEGKLAQVKASLKSIIKSMTENDSFEVLAFSTEVASLGVFNRTSLRRALRRVRKLQPMSYSDLNKAYLEAVKSADAYDGSSSIAKQIFVITDGHPTHGILDPESIRKNVFEANRNKHLIFGIGLGPDAHFNLIQQISADSEAFARQLGNKKSLSRDLQRFYREISRPILTNLAITYPENEVDSASVVKIATKNFYSGGEVISVGRALQGVRNIHPWVTGVSHSGPLQLPMDSLDTSDAPLRDSAVEDSAVVRLWAFLTVQHLLKEAEMNDNYVQVNRLLEQATQLALKFRFVTHVTSLMVRDATGEYEVDFLERDSLHLPIPHVPEYAAGHRGPEEIRLSDDPRGPRKQRYPNRTQGYVDLDPHFVVYSPGMDLPFCFDYHAHDGAYISIIRDEPSGIIVNGETMSDVDKPKLTYISKLFISLKKVNITLTPDTIEVDCMADDGSLKVDRVTKSLWPFYKKNGERYKKMAIGRTRKHKSARRPARPPIQLSRDPSRSVSVQEAESHRSHHYSTYPRPTYQTPPPEMTRHGLKTFPEEASRSGEGPEEIHYVMNSVADDYIPHQVGRTRGHSATRQDHRRARRNRRLSRQSDVSGKRSRRLKGTSQKDYGLCNTNSSWENGVGKKYGDVMIVLNKRKHMHIMVGDGGAHFAIVRSHKDGQKFLGFYIEDEKIMSPEAHGLIGQFTSKNITMSADPSQSQEENSLVNLVVKRRNRRKRYRVSHVSGFLSNRRSLLKQKHLECIQVKRQGKGLIDGRPKDYLLECLRC